jgi:uroporphyrinogen decarboxylase
MFSPAVFADVFLPVYRRMVATLKAAGAPRVLLHCDGNLMPLLDLLVEAGFDGINPVEYGAGIDVGELLPRYWGKLCFVGGVCNTHILPRGDAAAIRRHVERLVDAGRNGGLVIGTHSIGPDISVASYELYRRIVLECGGRRG